MRRIRQAHTWLSCVFPTKHPVAVEWSKAIGGYLGLCQLQQHERTRKQRYLVQLRPRLNLQVALDTMIHEWAHALTMSGMMESEDVHSSRFYDVLGQIERAWLGGGRDAARRLEV